MHKKSGRQFVRWQKSLGRKEGETGDEGGVKRNARKSKREDRRTDATREGDGRREEVCRALKLSRTRTRVARLHQCTFCVNV